MQPPSHPLQISRTHRGASRCGNHQAMGGGWSRRWSRGWSPRSISFYRPLTTFPRSLGDGPAQRAKAARMKNRVPPREEDGCTRRGEYGHGAARSSSGMKHSPVRTEGEAALFQIAIKLLSNSYRSERQARASRCRSLRGSDGCGLISSLTPTSTLKYRSSSIATLQEQRIRRQVTTSQHH